MRDYTYPVVTGMFILGALMILAATTSANAASQASATPEANKSGAEQPMTKIQVMVRREKTQQLEVQRATAIHMRAEKNSGKQGYKPDPGCVICKID